MLSHLHFFNSWLFHTQYTCVITLLMLTISSAGLKRSKRAGQGKGVLGSSKPFRAFSVLASAAQGSPRETTQGLFLTYLSLSCLVNGICPCSLSYGTLRPVMDAHGKFLHMCGVWKAQSIYHGTFFYYSNSNSNHSFCFVYCC